MKTIEVVAAIIHHDGKILATQRGYGEFKDGLEVEIKPEKLLVTVEYDYPKFHLTMHCFISSIVSGHILLTEHEAAKWLLPSELATVDWLPADVEVAEKLKEYLAGKNH